MKNDKYILNRDKQIFKYGDEVSLIFTKNVEGGVVEVPVKVTLDGPTIPSLLSLGVIEKFSVDPFPIEEVINESEIPVTKDFIHTLNQLSRIMATHFLLRLCSLYKRDISGIPISQYPIHWYATPYELIPVHSSFSDVDLFSHLSFTGIFPSKEDLVEAFESVNRFLDSLS